MVEPAAGGCETGDGRGGGAADGGPRLSGARPRVVVDCDPGIDDALALLMLARLHHRGAFVLDSVVAVAGNAGVGCTAANARFILDRAGLPEVPVFTGAAGALDPLPEPLDASAYHGPDGIGGCYEAVPGTEPLTAGGPGVLADRLREAARHGPTALLALGPMTDVALALDGGLAGVAGRVVVMGGAFGDPGGNVTDLAEYNWHFDPAAADRVVRSGVPLEVVPLDVTEKVVVGRGDLGALDADGPARLARQMLGAAIGYEDGRGGRGTLVHDALAAAILVEPALAGFQPRALSVETASERRGHAVASEPGPVRVALEVDVAWAKALILGLLAG